VLGTSLHQNLVICTETSRREEKEEGIRKEEENLKGRTWEEEGKN
jgi:hypothetical protein